MRVYRSAWDAIAAVRTHRTYKNRIKERIVLMNGNSKAAAAPFKKPWPIPIKDADLERLLERLDRILRDVEQVADIVADRLGVDLTENGGDTEEEDSEDEVDSQKQ